MEEKACSTDNCKRPYYAKGWCETCYHKFRTGPECKIDGCTKLVRARGWCKKHYTRWKTYGNAEEPMKVAPAGTGNVDNGYRRHGMQVGGKFKLVREHRVVMEQMLDRPLRPFENVHHKNGQRADNRPENLELWVKPQPTGGRLEDLIAFVVENYPQELLDALRRADRL